MKLKPYEFSPKDLKKLVQKHASIDPAVDMKAAKKARTEIKKKIKEVKDVHTWNKKIVLQFKRDIESFDKGKFEQLTVDLVSAFEKIDAAINNIESGSQIRDTEITQKINDMTNGFTNEILDAVTTQQIEELQVKIGDIKAEPADFDTRTGEVDSLKTSLLLKASGRATEIANAGGTISRQAIDPIKMDGMSTDMKHSDAEMINFIEKQTIPSKGWIVMINPHTGLSIYQGDSPHKTVREALSHAIDNHITV